MQRSPQETRTLYTREAEYAVVPMVVRNYWLTFLRLAKDCKGSNPNNNLQKIKGIANAIPFFLGGEQGAFFGVLPYAFASLRSLTTDFQTVHRTVFIGKADRPCSNPLLSYQQKTKGIANAIPFILGGEQGAFFGVLPYAFASLRSLTTDFQTVHRTVFIGKADRPCSNPLLSYQQKITVQCLQHHTVISGGEQGIRTLETVLAVYTISNRAPSTSSDNSPCHL